MRSALPGTWELLKTDGAGKFVDRGQLVAQRSGREWGDANALERNMLPRSSMVRIALLLALLLACTGCVDGNTVMGRWNATNCDDGFFATGVTVAVAGTTGTTTDHASCGDGGFAITVPYPSALVTVTDGAGSSWSSQIVIDSNVDLGWIYFDRGTPQD